MKEKKVFNIYTLTLLGIKNPLNSRSATDIHAVKHMHAYPHSYTHIRTHTHAHNHTISCTIDFKTSHQKPTGYFTSRSEYHQNHLYSKWTFILTTTTDGRKFWKTVSQCTGFSRKQNIDPRGQDHRQLLESYKQDGQQLLCLSS